MEVRQLTMTERLDAERIARIAFHVHQAEEPKLPSEPPQDEDWGAFSDSGEMMAHILNNRFTVYLDGHTVPCGGIGAVSTLPEYRETGAIRAIFSRLLPSAYASGEVLSALYPFNHAFYRKFGYETVTMSRIYDFAPQRLRGYRFKGEARRYREGDPIEPYTAMYNRFAAAYNLAAVRDDACMLKPHLHDDSGTGRKFTYLLRDGGRDLAYLTYTDVYADPQARLKVEDVAWDGRDGFRAILGFLGRFTADYSAIELTLPLGIELLPLLACDNLYDVKCTTHVGYMVRAVNAQRLLSAISLPEGCSYTIRVSDDLIAQNNAVYRVDASGAAVTADAPDLEADVRALAQLCVGAVSLREALLRDDVELHANAETLHRVFPGKPLYMAEHF